MIAKNKKKLNLKYFFFNKFYKNIMLRAKQLKLNVCRICSKKLYLNTIYRITNKSLF